MSSSHQMGQRVRMLYDQAIDDIATHLIAWLEPYVMFISNGGK